MSVFALYAAAPLLTAFCAALAAAAIVFATAHFAVVNQGIACAAHHCVDAAVAAAVPAAQDL